MSKQKHWTEELQSMIRDPLVLCQQLQLPKRLIPKAQQVAKQFPLQVTTSFISRMKKGDLEDPLLKQVLPLSLEAIVSKGFSKDPLTEKAYNPIPGLLHKYQGRLLITITGACAIHCRYCFRRHFPYHHNIPGRQLNEILDYISSDKSVFEVILSGGDPLIASDEYLKLLLSKLGEIAHLKVIRLHTRLPIVLPNRINSDFTEIFTQTRLKPVFVIHCNHAQEIDQHVEEGLAKLVRAGIYLLNQSVLLKGINDTVEILSILSHRLFGCRVLPYYLHMLDKVQGAAHFEVNRERAKHLYYELRAQLPGYLVPLLVEEKPGAPSKLPII